MLVSISSYVSEMVRSTDTYENVAVLRYGSAATPHAIFWPNIPDSRSCHFAPACRGMRQSIRFLIGRPLFSALHVELCMRCPVTVSVICGCSAPHLSSCTIDVLRTSTAIVLRCTGTYARITGSPQRVHLVDFILHPTPPRRVLRALRWRTIDQRRGPSRDRSRICGSGGRGCASAARGSRQQQRPRRRPLVGPTRSRVARSGPVQSRSVPRPALRRARLRCAQFSRAGGYLDPRPALRPAERLSARHQSAQFVPDLARSDYAYLRLMLRAKCAHLYASVDFRDFMAVYCALLCAVRKMLRRSDTVRN